MINFAVMTQQTKYMNEVPQASCSDERRNEATATSAVTAVADEAAVLRKFKYCCSSVRASSQESEWLNTMHERSPQRTIFNGPAGRAQRKLDCTLLAASSDC